ncbi:MAG: RidA family protein [Proteobacteria bacterium]|nr:RidA family protein [Pseudomonadota bacterium]
MISRGFLIGALIGAGWLAASPTLAEDLPTTIIRPGEDRLQITRLPTPGGEVILPTAKDRLQNHDQYLYAAARRAGDFVYLAGVIVGRLPGEGNDTEAFKAQLRRAFATIDRNLKASGASMADVVDMQTLAVFGGPDFTGDMTAELNAYAQVKAEFMKPPYPTETLVGVKQLVEPGGLMEIRVIAYAPKRRIGRR